MDEERKRKVAIRTGVMAAVVGVVAVVVIAVFVALGGPMRNMFSNAVGTSTMGQNQAALSAGIYGEDYVLPPIARATPGFTSDRAVTQASPARSSGHEAIAPPSTPSVVERQASLTLEVPDVRASFKRTNEIVRGHGGRVLESLVSQNGVDGKPIARIAARVPVDDLDEVTATIEEQGLIVTQNLDNQDRTDAAVGLESRQSELEVRAAELARRIEAESAALASDVARGGGGESARAAVAERAEAIRQAQRELAEAHAAAGEVASRRTALAAKTDFARIEVTFQESDARAVSAMFQDFTRTLTSSASLAAWIAARGLSILLVGFGAILPWALAIWVPWRFLRARRAAVAGGA